MTTHTCHWPRCGQSVPPSMWGCKRHWLMIPFELRQRIWHNYIPGQEITKKPPPAYIEAANEVQQWIANRKAKP